MWANQLSVRGSPLTGRPGLRSATVARLEQRRPISCTYFSAVAGGWLTAQSDYVRDGPKILPKAVLAAQLGYVSHSDRVIIQLDGRSVAHCSKRRMSYRNPSGPFCSLKNLMVLEDVTA